MSDESQNVQQQNAEKEIEQEEQKIEQVPTPKKRTVLRALKILLVVIPILSILALITIHYRAPKTTSEITADGMIEFVVGFLSCVSTIILAAITIYHTEILQRENDRAQTRMEEMNRRANTIAVNANELNMITKIIDFESNKYQSIKKLLYHYCELTDSKTLESLLRRLRKKTSYEQEEENMRSLKEYTSAKNESRIIASKIAMILSQDGRYNNSSKNDLSNAITSLQSTAFPDRRPTENDKSYLQSVDTCRKSFVIYMVRYLSDYAKDINHALYTSMTLAEVRNLFNPPNKENAENGQDENGIPESDSGEH